MAEEKKQVSLQVKCDPNLRKAFKDCCKGQDQSSSQVIRAYMIKYIAKNGQGDLF